MKPPIQASLHGHCSFSSEASSQNPRLGMVTTMSARFLPETKLGDGVGSEILRFMLSLSCLLRLFDFPLLVGGGWGEEGRPFSRGLQSIDPLQLLGLKPGLLTDTLPRGLLAQELSSNVHSQRGQGTPQNQL